MKKTGSLILLAAMLLMLFASCSSAPAAPSETATPDQSPTAEATDAPDGGTFDTAQQIGVLSREDGSGTRSAFVELFGVEEKDENGEKVDRTTEAAAVNSSTNVMMTTVASNPYAIGYISLGSLNETVKAVKIDGTEATVENIKSGDYKIARPFNIAVKENVSEAAQDFIDFIMSKEGQAVVAESGYITVADDAAPYAGGKPAGKIVVAGSSSVTPVMEKLKEAYLALNASAEIEIQQSDSTTGMTSAMDGICDIGMASRELKDSELKSLTPTVIAMDGIAVIVNNSNPLEELESGQVKSVYVGETTLWSDILG